ncbi:MAG TPA: alpha/beta fold hydrolase [Micromonosporaceae bacterium]|nr:alpha/beta fold hydrolase [Micromonosporaceae bacterium]
MPTDRVPHDPVPHDPVPTEPGAGAEYVQHHVDRGTDRLGVQLYPEPDGDAPAPAVVLWPAMGVPARYYRPFAGQLRARGLSVAVADLRGTGSSTPRPGRASRYGYAELAADVGAVLDDLESRLDGRPVVLLGHSLGGQACLLHLATGGHPSVSGLALVAVGLPYWRLYRWSRRPVLPYSQAIAGVAALMGYWPGWTFGGRQARGVIRDWAHTARTGSFPGLAGADAEAAVRRVTTPVLAVSVEADQYTPSSTVDHLAAKLAAAPVEREHYTAATAGAPLGHFGWVRAGGPLADRIAAFARRPGG